MLVALTISATLLAAMLQALDVSWKGYKQTTESVSTHVVSRIVTHRMLAMIRTGADFGPYPADFFDPDQNPVITNEMEFIAEQDRINGTGVVTRIVRRDAEEGADAPFELWYERVDEFGDLIEERPLLSGVREAVFLLEFEPGPRLVKATIDLTVDPNDEEAIVTGGDWEPPAIRLVASASPRLLD